MRKYISSSANPVIKELLRLSKRKGRDESGLFVVEGVREAERALNSGTVFTHLFFNENSDSSKLNHLIARVEKDSTIEIIEVSPAIYSKIAYRDQSSGIVCIARQKVQNLNSLTQEKNGLYLVIETVEKPGNLGAILRTADAAKVSAVLVCDHKSDLYNPNVVRSSLGCLFAIKVIQCTSEEAVQFLLENRVNIFAATLQDSKDYYDEDFSGPTAIVVGSEAEGLSEVWRKAATALVRIPMKGVADSLNVSVSAAILVFEAVRQRRKRIF